MRNSEFINKLKLLVKDHLDFEIELINNATFDTQEELTLHMGKLQAFNQIVAELELISCCPNCNQIH